MLFMLAAATGAQNVNPVFGMLKQYVGTMVGRRRECANRRQMCGTATYRCCEGAGLFFFFFFFFLSFAQRMGGSSGNYALCRVPAHAQTPGFTPSVNGPPEQTQIGNGQGRQVRPTGDAICKPVGDAHRVRRQLCPYAATGNRGACRRRSMCNR